VLDGEIFIKDKYTTSKVMNSSPIRSRRLQRELGSAKLYVFDILRYKDNDLRGLPYKTRLKFLERAVGKRNPHVKVVPSFKKNKKAYYKRLVKQGWEGVVLKDLRGKYNDRFMTKMKPIKDSDFVVMDYTPGKGKYKGLFGAIVFGKYINGKLQRVGKVGTGFDEKTRIKLSKMLPDLKRSKAVIAIKHLGLSHKGVPVGPVFDRVRKTKTWHDLHAESLGQ
jgi:ATP-dependent DNA ligase